MFALKEEGMEDEVSELLRTTKRFLGKSRVVLIISVSNVSVRFV